jgi:hypothetical protein
MIPTKQTHISANGTSLRISSVDTREYLVDVLPRVTGRIHLIDLPSFLPSRWAAQRAALGVGEPQAAVAELFSQDAVLLAGGTQRPRWRRFVQPANTSSRDCSGAADISPPLYALDGYEGAASRKPRCVLSDSVDRLVAQGNPTTSIRAEDALANS